MSICDFLFSADLCVAAADEALERLEAVLDLPRPGPGAYVKFQEEGWDVVFALVNKNFAAAPTRLEIIAPLDPPKTPAPRTGRRVYDAQAPRTWRTHATVVATPDIEALAERVASAGVRHWLQAPTTQTPFARLWMGSREGDVADYDPAADAGFRFEFLPSNSSAFSPKLFQAPVDKPQPKDTGLRRILGRSFLVADLDETLRRLETVFGWTPSGPVRDETARGYRCAEMSRNQAHGAALRLVQPVDPDSLVGRDFAAQGPGPYAITIAAFDLETLAGALVDRGASVRRLPAGRWEPEAILPEGAGLGAPIVLVPDEARR